MHKNSNYEKNWRASNINFEGSVLSNVSFHCKQDRRYRYYICTTVCVCWKTIFCLLELRFPDRHKRGFWNPGQFAGTSNSKRNTGKEANSTLSEKPKHSAASVGNNNVAGLNESLTRLAVYIGVNWDLACFLLLAEHILKKQHDL